MYGHPHEKDPWSDRQPIPDYIEQDPTDAGDEPSGFIVGCTVVALPVFVLAFSLGYMSGAWGWI